MRYLGYSELTNRLYVLPASRKAPKIDITDDANEYMRSKLGDTIYVPCFEYDPDICGCFTSTDGQSLCYVKEVKL